jgi:eukaryotic-like serine/threonine-protein kinase
MEKTTQRDLRLCNSCNKIHGGVTTCPHCDNPLTLIEPEFFIGKSFGKYNIKDKLGKGGMGIVFLAVHCTLNKKVALKSFVPNSGNTNYEKRFFREARIMAELKHQNIVEIYDFDISPWGTPYYVMEYLHGKTLKDEIRWSGSGLPVKVFLDYLQQIVNGLGFAHKKGIVHRDLKPDNIFIEDSHGKKTLKILDFGIAKSMFAGPDATHLTATRAVLGTPFYLSPEQIINKNIGAHTDQYALALIVYEMLTGEVARAGKSVGEILYSEAREALNPQKMWSRKLPKRVVQALVKATDPNPRHRFSDVLSFGDVIMEAYKKSRAEGSTMVAITREVNKDDLMTKPFLSIEEEVLLEARQKKKKKFLIIALTVVIILAVIIISLI